MTNRFKNDPALMACLTQYQFKQSVLAKDIATLTADVKAVKSSTEEQKKATLEGSMFWSKDADWPSGVSILK